MTAQAKTTSQKKTSEKKDKDDGCRKVVTDYFELTGKTLDEQAKQYREISKLVAEGKYTAEAAQKDWQDCMKRTTDYGQKVTQLWFDGLTKCAWTPGVFWPGFSSFCGDSSNGKQQ